MNEALAASRPSSRLREWLRYDESLEESVDAAFGEFIERSRIVPLFIGGFVLSLIATPLLYLSIRGKPNALEIAAAANYVCLYGPVLLGIFQVRKPVLRAVLRGAVDPARGAMYATGLALAAVVVEIVVGALISALHLSTPAPSIFRYGVIVAVLSGTIFAPIIEEAFFQGWLQTRLERAYPKGAIGITTLVFLLFHMPRGLSQCIRGFGLYANGVLRRDTRSLGAPIIAHFVTNVIAVGLPIMIRGATHRPLHW